MQAFLRLGGLAAAAGLIISLFLLKLEISAREPVSRLLIFPLIIGAVIANYVAAVGVNIRAGQTERPWNRAKFWWTAAYVLLVLFGVPRLLDLTGVGLRELIPHPTPDGWIVKGVVITALISVGFILAAVVCLARLRRRLS